MPSKLEYYYFDSCVFMSYIGKYPDRIVVLDSLMDEVQRDRSCKILTSTLSIAEVAFASGHGKPKPITKQQEEAIDKLWHADFIEKVDAAPFIMLEARTIMRNALINNLKVPSASDAIHIATASWVHQKIRPVRCIFTYEGEWKRYEDLIGIKVDEPRALQLSLLGSATPATN